MIVSQLNSCCIYLTLSAKICAEDFARQQLSGEKARQVYFNTLAVFAVNTYLQCLGWTTSLETSNSWNSPLQMLLDTADLDLPGYGKVECRPVKKEEGIMSIPDEIDPDTIVCIAVDISQSPQYLELLGFVTQFNSLTVSLNSLQPMEELSEYLVQSKLNLATKETNLILESSHKHYLPQLSDWLLGFVEAGWQTLETVSDFYNAKQEIVFRVASSSSHSRLAKPLEEKAKTQEILTQGVSRVKLWRLGKNKYDPKIALVISVSPTHSEELEISLKVCPTNNNHYLPVGLLITVLDEEQQPVLQASTKSNNEMIEFFLNGEAGEIFTIQATYNDEIIMESFLI